MNCFKMQQLLWFIVVIVIVVFVHEFGHFYMARLFGVRVEKFSIGFGPSIWSFKDKNKVQWMLSLIPLGGYVKLHGDEQQSKKDSSDTEAFSSKKPMEKFCIAMAGPLANYILAFICFVFIMANIGVMKFDGTIASVQEGSIAESIGLNAGDKLSTINDHPIKDIESLRDFLSASEASESITIGINRNEETLHLFFTFPENDTEKKLGVLFDYQREKANFFTVLKESFVQCYILSKNIFISLINIIRSKDGLDAIGGPLRISEYSAKVAAQGILPFINFIAIISLNLGLMNLLPIPLLDGGRMLVYIIEFLKGSPMSDKVQAILFKIGFVVLFALMYIAISNDIKELIK